MAFRNSRLSAGRVRKVPEGELDDNVLERARRSLRARRMELLSSSSSRAMAASEGTPSSMAEEASGAQDAFEMRRREGGDRKADAVTEWRRSDDAESTAV
mmetsp:Transcript_29821/g.54769  ORF Transcript_29821/g.54769 Transcript_29821/m.54769 type:complete len:100 (-) Transcript_29821:271-570(-)